MDHYKIEKIVDEKSMCHMCKVDVDAVNVFVGYDGEYDFFVYVCEYHTNVLKDHAETEIRKKYI